MPIYLDHVLAATQARCAAENRRAASADLYAAPMIGGMISSTILTLAVIPAVYALVREWDLRRRPGA